MRVLIVDRDADQRKHLIESLAQLSKVEVTAAVSNVRGALKALGDTPPDVVITEALLPDGGWGYLIHGVRRLAPAPQVVVFGAAKSPEHRAGHLATGADVWVERDAGLTALTQAVAHLPKRAVTPTAVPKVDTERLLGRLAASLVHDANNYLAALDGALALLRHAPKDVALWAQIQGTLAALGRLNSTVLQYARGVPAAPVPVDFAALVKNVLVLATPLLKNGIKLEVDVQPQLPELKGVVSELEQMVLNLVVNAIDAMPNGGELNVSVTAAGAALMLRVKDSGVGLESEAGPGGLGLSIVHSVVERHHGAVSITPRAGAGTLVTLVLPIQ